MNNPLFMVYWKYILMPLIREPYYKTVRSRYDYTKPAPTLVTSNCVGGVIYNDLGLQFTSPTVNLWFHENHFLKFATNFERYKNVPLRFVQNEKGDYPKGQIDDIDIYFLHYKTAEEAERKWSERYQRADFSNTYIILNDMELEPQDYEMFHQLKCKRKIMFTTNPQHANWDNFFYIKNYEPNSYVRKHTVKRMNGHYDFEMFFDYVAWINGDTEFTL